jgi:hypothetical protein
LVEASFDLLNLSPAIYKDIMLFTKILPSEETQGM